MLCSVDKAQGRRLTTLITREEHPGETGSYWYNGMEVSHEKGTAIKLPIPLCLEKQILGRDHL